MQSGAVGAVEARKVKQLACGSWYWAQEAKAPSAARRNKILRPLLSAVLRPFFWIVRVDVQRMGRKGFISWAWSRDENLD